MGGAKWSAGQHSKAGNSTTEGFETANVYQGHISPLYPHSTGLLLTEVEVTHNSQLNFYNELYSKHGVGIA